MWKILERTQTPSMQRCEVTGYYIQCSFSRMRSSLCIPLRKRHAVVLHIIVHAVGSCCQWYRPCARFGGSKSTTLSRTV